MNLEDELRLENATLEPNVTDEWWLYGNVTSDDATDVTATISLGFVDSVIKSFSVMIVSELGDKTFFLAGEMSVVDDCCIARSPLIPTPGRGFKPRSAGWWNGYILLH